MSVPILGVVNFRRLRKLGGFIEVPFSFITLVFLLLSTNALAEKTDIVQSYTMEEMYEMAELYKQISINKPLGDDFSFLQFMKAGQFRGYVASQLDFSTNVDKTLVDCAKRRSLNFIAYRMASLITSFPLDRSSMPLAAMAFSIHYACDDSKWSTK